MKSTTWALCAIALAIAVSPSFGQQAGPLVYQIDRNSDDGIEAIIFWLESGIEQNGSGYRLHLDHLGKTASGIPARVGLRFTGMSALAPGDQVEFARLRFASFGSDIASGARLQIEGIKQESATTFSLFQRPSQKLPKTATKVDWIIGPADAWKTGLYRDLWGNYRISAPLYYSSPDVSAVVNEILALPGWGSGPEGKTMAFSIKDNGSANGQRNTLAFHDRLSAFEVATPARLEIYRTVADTLIGRECLGRVTDSSATVNMYSLIDTDMLIQYGTAPGNYTHQTDVAADNPAGQAVEIVMDGLAPNTRYYYRLGFRRAGEGDFAFGAEHSFRTHRPPGSDFTFSMTADEHTQHFHNLPPSERRQRLYRTALQNIASNQNPEFRQSDFWISLGDFVLSEDYINRSSATVQDAKARYLLQRRYIDEIAHSIPFYLVIGNHEGEQGWYDDGSADNLAVYSTLARKELIPNPFPDGFHSGNDEVVPHQGLREDYFAWTWGDALLVVIDPFWYTRSRPFGIGDHPGSEDGWDWTLGRDQYEWLHDTLAQSDARWKFVFTHHLVTTAVEDPSIYQYYGRGGIEVAPYFEWGGRKENGGWGFNSRRPGWSYGPIHDILVANEVAAVFHGHDHFFARQELDGITYQACPQPADDGYAFGFYEPDDPSCAYAQGDFRPNSGHIQVTVTADEVTVRYIRAYLPEDEGQGGLGFNGETGFSYSITEP